jgi:hypothetical protein
MSFPPTKKAPWGLIPVGLAVIASFHAPRARGYGNDENVAKLLFTGEHIALSLFEGELRVEGVYEFTNSGSKTWTGPVAYPIAVSDTQLPPDVVVAENRDALPVRCYSEIRCYSRFNVELNPGQSKRFSVNYSQKLLANEAVYLLTSTQSWKAPLRWARYTVSVPGAWRDVQFSYDGDIRNIDRGRKLFETARSDFVPGEDLTVRWRVPVD